MGLDNMGGISADRVTNSAADSLGGNAGEDMHQLSAEELASHNHSIGNSPSGSNCSECSSSVSGIRHRSS